MSDQEQPPVAETEVTPETGPEQRDRDVNGIVSWVQGRDISINGIAGTVMAGGSVRLEGGVIGRVVSGNIDVKSSTVLLLASPSPRFEGGSSVLFTPPAAAALGAGFAIISFLLGKLFGRKRK